MHALLTLLFTIVGAAAARAAPGVSVSVDVDVDVEQSQVCRLERLLAALHQSTGR